MSERERELNQIRTIVLSAWLLSSQAWQEEPASLFTLFLVVQKPYSSGVSILKLVVILNTFLAKEIYINPLACDILLKYFLETRKENV